MATQFNEELWYGNDNQHEASAEDLVAKSIAAKVGRVIGAKPFPIAAQRLTELTRDLNCSMDTVVKVLESDPALSARLLRLVNSSGFALRTSCSSVRHAAVLVGNRRLNQVATTAAILDMFDASTEVAAGVLEHATIVGALSRYLGAHFGLPPDEMFTCGFLHDIGKLMLLESEGAPYQQLLAQFAGEPDVIFIKERELYGYDHAILAGHVLSAWRIPAPVPKVVGWHHQITRAYDDSPQVARMVSVLRLADALAYVLFRQFPEFEVEKLARSEAASYLEISEPQIAAMWDTLYALAETARAGFRGEEPKLENRVILSARAPANDVAAESGASHGLPRQFPCVVCGVGSYANVCRVCHGYVCPTHQDPEDEWCALCWAEFDALEVRLPPWLYSVLGTAIGAMLVGTVVGAWGAVDGETLEWLIAPGLISLSVVVILWTWQRWFRRVWFARSAPDRTGLAPALPDGPVPEVTDAGEPVPTMQLSRRIVTAFDLKSGGSVVEHIDPQTSPLSWRAPAADGFVSALRPHSKSEANANPAQENGKSPGAIPPALGDLPAHEGPSLDAPRAPSLVAAPSDENSTPVAPADQDLPPLAELPLEASGAGGSAEEPPLEAGGAGQSAVEASAVDSQPPTQTASLSAAAEKQEPYTSAPAFDDDDDWLSDNPAANADEGADAHAVEPVDAPLPSVSAVADGEPDFNLLGSDDESPTDDSSEGLSASPSETLANTSVDDLAAEPQHGVAQDRAAAPEELFDDIAAEPQHGAAQDRAAEPEELFDDLAAEPQHGAAQDRGADPKELFDDIATQSDTGADEPAVELGTAATAAAEEPAQDPVAATEQPESPPQSGAGQTRSIVDSEPESGTMDHRGKTAWRAVEAAQRCADGW